MSSYTLRCCSNRRDKVKAKSIAKKSLANELDLVTVIKKQRYFNEALKNLLTLEQRMKLKEQANFITVDPSNEDLQPILRVKEQRLSDR